MYGGWLPSYRGLRQWPSLHHVEVFNCNLCQWTQRGTTGTLPPPLEGSACTCIGRLLYLFGGWTGRRFSNSVYELRVTTSRWRELRPVNPEEGPMPKSGCGIISTSATTLCMIGGYGVPYGSLQPGSKFVQDKLSKNGEGWSNEIHSFDIPSGNYTLIIVSVWIHLSYRPPLPEDIGCACRRAQNFICMYLYNDVLALQRANGNARRCLVFVSLQTLPLQVSKCQDG